MRNELTIPVVVKHECGAQVWKAFMAANGDMYDAIYIPDGKGNAVLEELRLTETREQRLARERIKLGELMKD